MGKFQFITSILKIIPLLLTIIISFFVFDIKNFFPINLSELSNFHALSITTAMTFFAFLGIESATIPTDGTESPEKTIPLATTLGTFITIAIYIFSSIALMGIISPNDLALSNAPFADAINVTGEVHK